MAKAKVSAQVPAVDMKQESIRLDIQAKKLNDVVLVCQAWHALETTFAKYNVPLMDLHKSYYAAYQKFFEKCSLDYANVESLERPQA